MHVKPVGNEAHQHAIDLADGWFPMAEALLGYLHAQLGQLEEHQRILDRFEKLPEYQHISPYWTSIIHVGLGDHDKALDCLERAYAEKSDVVWQFLNKFPPLDVLKSDARYVDLLAKIGQMS